MITKEEKRALNQVQSYLEKLTGSKPGCGIKDETKADCRQYVESWILPLVEALQKDGKDRTRYERELIKEESRWC